MSAAVACGAERSHCWRSCGACLSCGNILEIDDCRDNISSCVMPCWNASSACEMGGGRLQEGLRAVQAHTAAPPAR